MYRSIDPPEPAPRLLPDIVLFPFAITAPFNMKFCVTFINIEPPPPAPLVVPDPDPPLPRSVGLNGSPYTFPIFVS